MGIDDRVPVEKESSEKKRRGNKRERERTWSTERQDCQVSQESTSQAH
jgi:uncharacterized protein